MDKVRDALLVVLVFVFMLILLDTVHLRVHFGHEGGRGEYSRYEREWRR